MNKLCWRHAAESFDLAIAWHQNDVIRNCRRPIEHFIPIRTPVCFEGKSWFITSFLLLPLHITGVGEHHRLAVWLDKVSGKSSFFRCFHLNVIPRFFTGRQKGGDRHIVATAERKNLIGAFSDYKVTIFMRHNYMSAPAFDPQRENQIAIDLK